MNNIKDEIDATMRMIELAMQTDNKIAEENMREYLQEIKTFPSLLEN